MKKGLIAAGLLVSLSGTAQDVSTYTPGTMGEGVVYYLPKTEIELQVIATKVVYTPGEFCQYADRYLRLTGISSQPEEHWEINSIKVNSIGIPDPDNAYAVKLKDKSAASQVELTPEGIIKAINTTSPIEKAPVTKVSVIAAFVTPIPGFPVSTMKSTPIFTAVFAFSSVATRPPESFHISFVSTLLSFPCSNGSKLIPTGLPVNCFIFRTTSLSSVLGNP